MERTGAVVEDLRSAIIRGEFTPGQRLVELELAAELSTSRGTVRQALAVLENEGLVVHQRNRGATVRPVSLEQAIEITEVRAVVEGLCARRASAAATAADKKRLHVLGDEMRAAVASGDVPAYNASSQEAHHVIRDLAAQESAAQVLDRLRYQSVRYQYGITLLPGRLEQGLGEHLAVIEAVTAGDPERAEAEMRAHLTSVIAALRKLGGWNAAMPKGLLGHVS
ncbi:GntR family transcriptional regulator [Streptomyces sp. NPDC047002]|uniref:GntR family transcriptional regulator n=1 Tax=Streptomyces sp. NPDC047002 TaxID=3155475 RepID=UPI0034519663